ncbi:hypothetical protein BC833DRAFT_198579 [Globomyces pollinis-pini]|nr:hypothetical protein BC833DRAFT_198579 [Globomyces pollinis-pini]
MKFTVFKDPMEELDHTKLDSLVKPTKSNRQKVKSEESALKSKNTNLEDLKVLKEMKEDDGRKSDNVKKSLISPSNLVSPQSPNKRRPVLITPHQHQANKENWDRQLKMYSTDRDYKKIKGLKKTDDRTPLADITDHVNLFSKLDSYSRVYCLIPCFYLY